MRDGGEAGDPGAPCRGQVDISRAAGKLWTPVRTRPKREKKLEEYCAAKGIACYLPLRKSVKRYGQRTFVFYPPMFPSYLFCQLDEASFQELLLSHAVLFRVKVDADSEASLVGDLREVQLLERRGGDKELVVKPELAGGTKVQVSSGPLKGVRGVVARRQGGVMLYVNIDILGNCVAVELDVGDVELED